MKVRRMSFEKFLRLEQKLGKDIIYVEVPSTVEGSYFSAVLLEKEIVVAWNPNIKPPASYGEPVRKIK